MNSFVLDASLALEWFTTGASASSLAKRSLLDDRAAVVPHLWRWEIMNAVTTWTRRGDTTPAEAALILTDIMQLPVAIVDEGDPELVVTLALQYNLSAYDATYLRAAMITGNPIATLDKALTTAAKTAGVQCL